MMPPNLTDDQKQHIRIAQRSRMRIEECWTLFNMYLGNGVGPAEALRKAQEAVSVWAEWMDSNEIDFPEIAQPNFVEELTAGMGKMFEQFPKLARTPAAFPAALDTESAEHSSTVQTKEESA